MSVPSNSLQNFNLPIDLSRFENDRLKLIPIENCTEASLEEYITSTSASPELWRFFPIGPHASVAAYKEWYDTVIRPNPASVIFAIYLKAGKVSKRRPGSNEIDVFEVADDTFAGTAGLINASAVDSTVEIGHIMILPQFQRTFVNTVTCCLFLRHLLDPIDQGDLQMRRVQWQAYSKNEPSVNAAKRLGFILEGIIRWQRVIGDNKTCVSEYPGERAEGKPVVDIEGRKLGPGRHSALLALCWDDWLDGKREHVLGLLARA